MPFVFLWLARSFIFLKLCLRTVTCWLVQLSWCLKPMLFLVLGIKWILSHDFKTVQHRANRTISCEPVLHSPDLKTMPHLTHKDLYFSAKSLFWPLCTDQEENALMHTNLAVALLPISQQSQCLLSLTLVSLLLAWLWVSCWKILFSCWKSQWSLLAEFRSYLPPPQSSSSLSFCSHLVLSLLPSSPIPSSASGKIIQKK